ncbi:exopolygalacturonase-like [Apium graveolens]|uniref:exopolygalacturonase-like n=1 Tax=Apium graveolens TaxID=4045 RepID=UPI003D7BA2BD
MLMSFCTAQNGANVRFYSVMSYGAVANGRDDNSKQFLRAWQDACEWNGKSVMFIPTGTYKLNPVEFRGPCKGSTAVRIIGDLQASANLSVETWITFQYVDWLLVEGTGTVDGQGASAWRKDDCWHNHRFCRPLPTSIGFKFVKNANISNLRMINSKSLHLKVFRSQKVLIGGVKITAPENSPNTDGICISDSQDVKVHDCNIACGDDCISMLTGNENVEIFNVVCGPGHGISVGSLGQGLGDGRRNVVTGLHIRNCTCIGTQNGLRIKTWAPSVPILVSDFVYEDIHMENSGNPIIIDQHYCPSRDCSKEAQSSVQIKNVTFKNVWGKSSTPAAITIQCSSKVPCLEFKLQDINLTYNGRGTAKSECINVQGQSYGHEQPPGCLKPILAH